MKAFLIGLAVLLSWSPALAAQKSVENACARAVYEDYLKNEA